MHRGIPKSCSQLLSGGASVLVENLDALGYLPQMTAKFMENISCSGLFCARASDENIKCNQIVRSPLRQHVVRR